MLHLLFVSLGKVYDSKIKESPLYSGLNKDFFHMIRNLKIHSCCPELTEIALAFLLWLQNGC